MHLLYLQAIAGFKYGVRVSEENRNLEGRNHVGFEKDGEEETEKYGTCW